MKNPNRMGIVERLQAPTPKLFRKIRNIGLIVGAAATAILGLPVAGIAIPAKVLAIALAAKGVSGAVASAGVGGAVAAVTSQLAVDTDKLKDQQ